MPGLILNVNASMQCPHGGTVQIVPTGKRPISGGPLVTIADQFLVAGCAYQIPATPPIPSPCVLVRFAAGEKSLKFNNIEAVSVSSTGTCYAASQAAQGIAIISNPGQTMVTAK